jgi:hypothetical protein
MTKSTADILQDLLRSIRLDIDRHNLTGSARTPEKFENDREACLMLFGLESRPRPMLGMNKVRSICNLDKMSYNLQ